MNVGPAEIPDTEEGELSRTAQLIKDRGLGDEFYDAGLPKGVFSYSQYNSFKICGEAYRFKYVDQVPTPGYVAPTMGSCAHTGMQIALNSKKLGQAPDLQSTLALVEEDFNQRSRFVREWENKSEAARALATVREMYTVFHTRALPNINPVQVEEGFAVKIADVPMIGWIDYIDERPVLHTEGMSSEVAALAPPSHVVVDLKTATAKWSENDVAKDAQLTCYSLVTGLPRVRVDQLVNRKSGVDFVEAESTRDQQAHRIFTEDLVEVVALIKKGVFPKASIDSWSCNEKHCSFYAQCRGRKR